MDFNYVCRRKDASFVNFLPAKRYFCDHQQVYIQCIPFIFFYQSVIWIQNRTVNERPSKQNGFSPDKYAFQYQKFTSKKFKVAGVSIFLSDICKKLGMYKFRNNLCIYSVNTFSSNHPIQQNIKRLQLSGNRTFIACSEASL